MNTWLRSIDSRCSYSVSQLWAFMFVVHTSNCHGQNCTRRAIFRLGIDTVIANILVIIIIIIISPTLRLLRQAMFSLLKSTIDGWCCRSPKAEIWWSATWDGPITWAYTSVSFTTRMAPTAVTRSSTRSALASGIHRQKLTEHVYYRVTCSIPYLSLQSVAMGQWPILSVGQYVPFFSHILINALNVPLLQLSTT